MSSRLIVLFFLICCATAEIRDEEFDLFPRLPLGVIDTDNVVCKKQSRVYIENLRNLSLWAHENILNLFQSVIHLKSLSSNAERSDQIKQKDFRQQMRINNR
ncbi:unnamed protein product [Acanthoscelides obtectus]|uniref:Uncharacterized protein n=1 Tax=Acanthoscelides obtectus TaxID=200917 RepID=A0A9P0KXA2_ACAOB|nr:unnamed protein product [Acanthoscelides obtectus]CAK1684506.1 hypothetical protein AOBTE_LOCUS34894 [Acanthoscelides obtectus]